MLVSVALDCVRGDDNIYDLDLTTAIPSPGADKFWFHAKRKFADLDTEAVIRKGLNVPGLSGISIIDAPSGKFQVQVLPEETAGLADQALHYDVQYKGAAENQVRTVARGVLLLSGEITIATS